jgi:hypothetical protein
MPPQEVPVSIRIEYEGEIVERTVQRLWKKDIATGTG